MYFIKVYNLLSPDQYTIKDVLSFEQDAASQRIGYANALSEELEISYEEALKLVKIEYVSSSVSMSDLIALRKDALIRAARFDSAKSTMSTTEILDLAKDFEIYLLTGFIDISEAP